MPNEVWTEGWLPDGTHIHVDKDPYTNPGSAVLLVGWEEVPIKHVTRLRDGGTTTVVSEKGTLLCYRRLGHPPHDEWTPAGVEKGTVLSVTPASPAAGEVWEAEDGARVKVENLRQVVVYRNPDAPLPLTLPLDKFKQEFKRADA